MMFRRTNRYGYSRYYGNTGTILRIVKIILFVLVMLALAAGLLVWSLHKYVVYDETGAHLELPWYSNGQIVTGGSSSGLTPEEDGSDGASSLLPEVIIDEGSVSAAPPESVTQPEASSQVTPEVPDEPVPDPALPQLLGVHVTRTDLNGGKGASLVKGQKGNAAVAYIKESSGVLNFHSSNANADRMSVNGSNKTLEQLLALKSEGVGSVAYLHCFRDSIGGSVKEYALLNKSGSRWKDGNGTNWVDPTNEAMQSYYLSLVTELAQAGVEEIVLDEAFYPIGTNSDKVKFDGDRIAVITAFYEKLAQAVQGTNTLLSVYTSETTVLEGSDAKSGQTLEAIRGLGGRVWVATGKGQELEDALVAAGFPKGSLCVVGSRVDPAVELAQCNMK